MVVQNQMSLLTAAASPIVDTGPSIGTPALWVGTIAAVVLLLALDFLITRKPHEVSMREAALWSAFYIALPLIFGVWVLQAHGGEIAVESNPGEGTTFRFLLPRVPPATAAAMPPA